MSTGVNGWRFPDYTDTPDVPRDLGNLGADIATFIAANPGPQGPSGTLAVGTVTTVSAATPASVVNVGTASNAILNLTLPRGVDGIIGGPGPSNVLNIGTVVEGGSASATITGTSPSQTLNLVLPQGPQGIPGPVGPQGPTTLAVGTTTTGNAGTNASVTNTGTATNAVFAFTIPRGATGATGATGPQGIPGSNATLNPISTTISLNAPVQSSGNNYGVQENWYPIFNNLYSLGQPPRALTPADPEYDIVGNRFWKTIYSNTGTINTSDQRLKTEISQSALGLDFINNLNPVSYKFIEGGKEIVDGDPVSIPGSRTHYGLIAQEVKEVLDEAQVDFGGWVLLDKEDPDSEQALRYEEFISPLIKAVQELTARVKALEEQ
jgi:hypothetical protein